MKDFDLNILIGLCGVVVGMLLGVKNYERLSKKDIKEETKEETQKAAEVSVKLDYISRGIEDIKVDIRSTNSEVSILKERSVRLEERVLNLEKIIKNLKED